jgi:hypothetical protein
MFVFRCLCACNKWHVEWLLYDASLALHSKAIRASQRFVLPPAAGMLVLGLYSMPGPTRVCKVWIIYPNDLDA